ncbi:MAG: efflux RND transporter periplasmic adaptor subunit [Bacteroidales bacterium]
MNKKIYIIAGIVILGIIIMAFMFSGENEEAKKITVKVKKGDFEIGVTSSGELEAENSENIMGPQGLMQIRVYNVKITDIIPEGTVIDSGAYVATLDRSEISGKLKDAESALETAQSNYTKVQLDTTLELRNLRDDLINKSYDLEEKKINLQQMKYEAPAVIRQGEIELEKSDRAYNQALKSYNLKLQQSQVKMKEAEIELQKQQRAREDILNIINQFVIRAPKKGMVIYLKEWNGSKRKVGSSIDPWSNTVATLPDLSSMISKTYVNEIDIRKIEKGQKVNVGIDAFPDKKFKGEIITVANVGEQLPNSDAKVFEVVIKLNSTDTVLRPSMTTSNTIITKTVKNVLYIPIEALQTSDSLVYVYLEDGLGHKKQPVKTGESNDNEIIITEGLKENDVILLNAPIEAKKE